MSYISGLLLSILPSSVYVVWYILQKMVHVAFFWYFLWYLNVSLYFNIISFCTNCSKTLKLLFPVMILFPLNPDFPMMQIFMVDVIISLLHMDNISANSMHCGSQESDSTLTNASSSGNNSSARNEGGNKMVISFTTLLLDTLRQNIPSSVVELENTLDGDVRMTSRQALEWRMSISTRFIEEWEWRLSILQHLLPLSERQWRWKEALTVLRAAPSKLLNLWVQLVFCAFCYIFISWSLVLL